MPANMSFIIDCMPATILGIIVTIAAIFLHITSHCGA